MSKNGIWIRKKVADGFIIIKAQNITERKNILNNVEIFRFDNNNNFINKLIAETASLRENILLLKKGKNFNTEITHKSFESFSIQLNNKFDNFNLTSEIAEKMGLPLDEYRDWEKAFNANVHQSLDEVYDEYSMWFVSKESTPEENLDRSQLKAILSQALKDLPSKEAMVIQLYYVEELNVYEIAEIMEITTGRVSQIKKSAVALLRSFITKSY